MTFVKICYLVKLVFCSL